VLRGTLPTTPSRLPTGIGAILVVRRGTDIYHGAHLERY
jgi:hypothetical protein